MHLNDLQKHVVETGTQVWGAENATNPQERLFRMAEEMFELLRAAGMKFSEAAAILGHEYYARQPGEVSQEIAGVQNTLLAFAASRGVDTEEVALADLSRVLQNKEHHRAKHAAKPASMRAA